MDNVERKLKGLLYKSNDSKLVSVQKKYQEKLQEYNRTLPTEVDKRNKLLKEIFLEVGKDCLIETPVHSPWGCKNTHLGNNVYANSNVSFIDDEHIYIGDYTMIAPNVIFTTAGHPILPSLRKQSYEFNAPIRVGKNVWIGANVTILPGVTIGDNTVIGAGSVVTKDIPANVVAFGVPCKVVRKIGKRDEEYFFKDKKIDIPLK